MRGQKPGKIIDNLWRLGTGESGVYFLQGTQGAALINGGMTYILPDVLSQMRGFGLPPEGITRLVILHSHFDHVGIIPYFKRKYPSIEVVASETAVKNLRNPKAVELVNSYNRMSAAGREPLLENFDLEWRDDIDVTPVREGDVIELGGAVLNIHEVPGHSNCSIAAYEPHMRALFPSDAVGIPFAQELFPSMNTNIDQYLQSLEKLKPLEPSIVCPDHYNYITGEEARQTIPESLKEAQRWRARFQDAFERRSGDIDAAAKEITTAFFREMPGYFISAEILEGVFRQTLKYIAKTSAAG